MDGLTVTVDLPRSVLGAAGIREDQLGSMMQQCLAVELYRSGRVSLGKAAELAGGLTKWDMMQVLAKYDVWLDYTAVDAEQDLKTLAELLDR